MSFAQWPLLGDEGLLLANILDGPNSHKSHCEPTTDSTSQQLSMPIYIRTYIISLYLHLFP